jgi:uncharacterized membrane protein YgdD (TMEM256/DUF423 family)
MTPSRFAVGMYVFGALSALVSVALAALTAHGLASLAPTGQAAVDWFKIATEFQMNHALALILVTAISEQLADGRPRMLMRAAAVLLAAGALLFPVGLYSLSFGGPVFSAPFGGVAAMAGWALFALSAVLAMKTRSETNAERLSD